MSAKNKVLGICLAKLQDRIRTEYLNAINRAASLKGWKVVTLNSFRDFRKNDLSVQGSKSIYKILNHEDIDVAVVFPESMNRSEVSGDVIDRALSLGKPVISIGSERQGCFSVIRDYNVGFRDLLYHVLDEHEVKETFFVGGFKDDDERTEQRIRAYREALKAHGLPFSEELVGYGEYKDEIVNIVIDKRVRSGNAPQAIFCIDDKTAVQVCEKLSEYDLDVPKDVIVTGFGGIPAAYYYHPSITSCSDDVEVFADMVLAAAEDAINGKEPMVYKNPFKVRIRRSCGCDMRSYLSAGRRSYDLAAARAAGIFVPDPEEIKTSRERYKKEHSGYLQDDTVFMPEAAKDGTFILYKKSGEEGFEGVEPEDIEEPEQTYHFSDIEIEKAAKRAMEAAEDKKCTGGHSEAKFRSGNHVTYIYKELDEIERHEDSTIAWMDRMLECTDIESICENISKRLPAGSTLYVFTKLLETGFDIDAFETKNLMEESLTVIDSKENPRNESNYPDPGEQPVIKVKNITKDYIRSRIDGAMLILNPVFIGDFVCGYYAVKTTQVSEIRRNSKLICIGLNMIFRFLANQNRQKQMLYNIENSTFVSSMTGLPNLKGLTRWFEDFSANEENHRKALNISVFSMPRYTYIYENYGLNEIEESVRFLVEKVRTICPKTSFIGQFAEGEFVSIDCAEPGTAKECSENAEDEGSGSKEMEAIFHKFDRIMEEHNRNSTKEYYLEVNYGATVVEEGWDSTLESLVRMAVSDMYLRRLRQGKMPVIRDKTFDREYFSTFELLVDRNLFRYHFQPIVDAGTGKIIAYEALMRTGGGISMSPLDVLDIAKSAQRLYDIEKATLFNVMQFYEDHLQEFGDRKVFINTIPGYYLNDTDRKELLDRFGKYLDQMVFEVTESNTVTDEELEKLRTPAENGKRASVAVDDYGTGHSNIVNLIRYTPQIIKIDRFLISNIQDDVNKQMFVKNTIEFAGLNGIKVLAEGVETFDELRKVIEYGVDYIQGYYTARPEAALMQQIPQNIRSEILNESIKAAKFDNDNLVYNAKAGETVNLLELTLKKYTVVFIPGGKVKVVGEPDNVIDMIIKTADNRKTELMFENINLRGELETTVQLGKNSETSLYIMGECTLNKDGISVPSKSRLTVSGPGNLHIITSRNLSIGIGSNCNEPHGDLSFDMTGTLKIVANGDKVVGIGGGRCDGSRIRLINGNFDISAKAIHAVAIGSDIGDTDIYIGRNVTCKLKSDGNDSIALGSISGRAEIVSRGKLEITGDGEKTVGIGSIYNFAKADILSNEVSVVLHSYCGMAIGSLSSKAELMFEDSKVNVYAEGTQMNGIGSGEDVANTLLNGGNVKVEILAGIPRSLGVQRGAFTLQAGSFTSMHDLDVNIKDEHGAKVIPRKIDFGLIFER